MSPKTKKTEKKPSTIHRHSTFHVSPSLQELLNRAAAFSQQLLDEQLREAGGQPRRRSRRNAPPQQKG